MQALGLVLAAILLLFIVMTWRACACASEKVGEVRTYVSNSLEESRQEQRAARQRIRAEEVEISDLSLLPTEYGGFELNARIRNLSTLFTLNTLAVDIQLSDCDSTGCDVVGDQRVSLLQVSVPPGQARDARVSITFPAAQRRRGEYRFQSAIAYTEGAP